VDELLDLALREGTTDLGINAMKVLVENPSFQGIGMIKMEP